MIREALLVLVVLSSLLPGGCDRRPTAAPPPQVPEVAVVTVQPQNVVLTTELPGRTAAYLVAEIRPQVNGLIQKRLFIEGSDVQAGQELYQIDPAPFQAVLNNAQAALGRAEAMVPAIQLKADRFKEALVDRAVSQQALDDANASLQQAQADVLFWRATVETARINLAYARVVSPISGRVGRSAVTDGAIVTAYQPVPLATIQQMDPIYVDVPQSTAELLRLRRRLEEGHLQQDGPNANKVQLILEDGTRYPQEGTLQFRDVTVDPTSASVILRMVFPNPNGVLLPGMFVRAVVTEGVNQQAILIPQPAVSRDPKGNPLALIVDGDGKVAPRMLRLDRALGDQWLVATGLAPGDRVIVEGLQRVRPGAAVKIAPADAERKSDTPPAAQKSN
jgi:membrane fusion protein (multidrug efflux system)